MSSELTKQSPFIKRFMAWSNDRFPFANVISGALSYFTMVSIGRFIAHKNVSDITYIDLIGALAFIGHLLILRVFDEHKDYQVDLKNHPERALSKGIITLNHLKLIAMPFPFIALLWSVLIDQGLSTAATAWIIMFTYSLLMAKEFFIGEWLSKRLIIYATSHMIVSPLMILWIIIGGMGYFSMTPLLILVLAMSFTGGISYEMTRKTRGHDEDPNLDAYNKYFGVNGCLAIIAIFNLASFSLGFKAIQLITTNSMIPLIILFLGFSCIFYPSFNFKAKQTEKARKINEGGLGLFFLGLYVSLLVALFL